MDDTHFFYKNTISGVMYHNFCVYDTHFLKLIQNLITTGKQFEELAWNIAYLWFDVNLVNGYETLI